MGWKLVRDHHKEQMENVISGSWRTSPDPVSALTRKLAEEYGEFAEDRDPAELYDIQDVLDELIILLDENGRHWKNHTRKLELLGAFHYGLEWHPNPSIEGWEYHR